MVSSDMVPFETIIRNEIRCCLCRSNMEFTAILQCEKGHNFCERCIFSGEGCPCCGSMGGTTRNLVLEELVESAGFSCEYESLGCSEKIKINLLWKHQIGCDFRSRQCPFFFYNSCRWMGVLGELEKHCEESHPHNISRESDWIILETVEPESSGHTISIIFKYGTAFLYESKFREQPSVTHLGQIDWSNEYSCSFGLRQRGTESFYEVLRVNFVAQSARNNNIVMPAHLLKRFLKHKNIAFKIELNSIDSLGNKSLKDIVMFHLQCLGCKKHIDGSIHTCALGHKFCLGCCQIFDSICRICSSKLFQKNIFLERIRTHFERSCPYYQLGCYYKGYIGTMVDHKKVCKLRPRC